jgi:hypothetical protein
MLKKTNLHWGKEQHQHILRLESLQMKIGHLEEADFGYKCKRIEISKS